MTDSTTTITLADDILLLLFDPSSGTIAGEGTALSHTLAGAILVDLAFADAIEIDERMSLRGRRIHARGDAPADPLLAEVWHRIAARPTDVQSLILQIGSTLRQPVIDRLVERGILRIESRRMLGIIPTTALVGDDLSRRDSLMAPVRAALVGFPEGDAPGADARDVDARTAALIGLLSASGSLPALHREIPWSGAVYTRGVAFQRGSWGTVETAEAVRRTIVAISTSTIFVAGVLPAVDD